MIPDRLPHNGTSRDHRIATDLDVLQDGCPRSSNGSVLQTRAPANGRAGTYRCKIIDLDMMSDVRIAVDENECTNARGPAYDRTAVDVAAWAYRRRESDDRGRVNDRRLAGEALRDGVSVGGQPMSRGEERNGIRVELDVRLEFIGIDDAFARQGIVRPLEILHDRNDIKPEACA